MTKTGMYKKHMKKPWSIIFCARGENILRGWAASHSPSGSSPIRARRFENFCKIIFVSAFQGSLKYRWYSFQSVSEGLKIWPFVVAFTCIHVVIFMVCIAVLIVLANNATNIGFQKSQNFSTDMTISFAWVYLSRSCRCFRPKKHARSIQSTGLSWHK